MNKTETERCDDIAKKILDLLGNCQITKLNYSFKDDKTIIMWEVDDCGTIFQTETKFGWKS